MVSGLEAVCTRGARAICSLRLLIFSAAHGRCLFLTNQIARFREISATDRQVPTGRNFVLGKPLQPAKLRSHMHR